MMDVSVVVPTFKRRDLLHRCLTRLCHQDRDPASFEIIITDDENNSETKLLVDKFIMEYPSYHFVYVGVTHAHGPAAARNAGWRRARGEIIAFTDDDCLPMTDWLSKGLRAFDLTVDAVWGKVIVPLPENPTDFQVNTAGLNKEEFVTANCFCRRAVLEKINGFDERFFKAWREDSDLYFTLMEIGAHIEYCAQAIVYHPARKAEFGASIFTQKNNLFEPLLYKKHPELYRQHIHFPVLRIFYAIVILLVTLAFSLIVGWKEWATVACVLWIMLTGLFIWERLKYSSRNPDHVFEMIITSLLIPPLAIYWRIVGALRFRVLFI